MELTERQHNLYNTARSTLLFDDLYEFILSLWPDEIDTTRRVVPSYECKRMTIVGLGEITDSHRAYLESLDYGNILVHLDYAVSIVVHKAAFSINVVRMIDINREYVRYLFEDKSIKYATETDNNKIPKGLIGCIDLIYDKKQIKKYFELNLNETVN
jgi:hypothetical protein